MHLCSCARAQSKRGFLGMCAWLLSLLAEVCSGDADVGREKNETKKMKCSGGERSVVIELHFHLDGRARSTLL